jgi:hypothetical protein
MLAQFPHFERLRVSDSEDIQRHTSRYAPFSDFHFSSLWSWDIDERVQVSELNGNLIVKFSDYGSGEPFYSFLGTSEVNRTAEALLELSWRQNLQPRLQLVPEIVARQLNTDVFSIAEDACHADYIVTVAQLCTYQGPSFASKRNDVQKFLRRSKDNQFEVLNLADPRILEQFRELFRRWHCQRRPSDDCAGNREFKAFERYLKNRPHEQLVGAGIFMGQSMVAFSLSEIVNEKYAFTPFEKAETTNFPGISAYLNQEVAKLLLSRGIEYINIEEDLGIPGLRRSKKSYAPCEYLKKFSVSRATFERLRHIPQPARKSIRAVSSQYALSS